MSSPETPSDTYPYGERRLTLRLLRYWQEKRGMHTMPIEADIDPDTLGDDWHYCFLLQARDVTNVQDYNFTYLGSKILEAYADGAMDAHNECMIGPNAYRLSSHFTKVIESEAPILDEGEFLNLHNRQVHYRQILLPLGTDGKSVEAIFGGMNYKIIP